MNYLCRKQSGMEFDMKIWFKNKILWYLKQLFPLKYHTEYGKNGKWYVTVWRMWFGRCFKIQKWEIVNNDL